MLNALFAHAYYFLIPLALLEGPLLAIACGIAASFGYLNPFLAYGILLMGDALPDAMYYWIGRWGATLPWVRRIATRVRLIRDNFLSMEHLWKTTLLPTIVSAKLAYGINPVLMVSAGLSGINFWSFMGYSLIVSSIYFAFLEAIGYGFAQIYGVFNVESGAAPFLIAALGLVCLACVGMLVYWARQHIHVSHTHARSNLIEREA